MAAFKGGYITRNYGQPEQATRRSWRTQSSYMQEQAFFLDYLPETAACIQPTMQRLLQAVLSLRKAAECCTRACL